MSDSSVPATKGDMQELSTAIAALAANMEKRFEKVDERMNQHDQQFQIILKRMEAGEEETRRHFDVALEAIRHDLSGATKDALEQSRQKTEDHEARITRLEQLALAA